MSYDMKLITKRPESQSDSGLYNSSNFFQKKNPSRHFSFSMGLAESYAALTFFCNITVVVKRMSRPSRLPGFGTTVAVVTASIASQPISSLLKLSFTSDIGGSPILLLMITLDSIWPPVLVKFMIRLIVYNL